MAEKFTLNNDEIEEDYFEGSAIIGIACAEQGYRFCWLVNEHFHIDFKKDIENSKNLPIRKINYHFAVYLYPLPGSDFKYHIYKLKDRGESLLPEAKQLDFVWIVQNVNPLEDAARLVAELKTMPEVQMAKILYPAELKSLYNLVL